MAVLEDGLSQGEGLKVRRYSLRSSAFPFCDHAQAALGASQNGKAVRLSAARLSLAEKGGFEPPVQFNPYGSLANYWFQPLTHLSVASERTSLLLKGSQI